MSELPTEAAAALQERGVFSRIWVDTLEDLVGLIENLARGVFRVAIIDAAQRVKGRGNGFQRLDGIAGLLADAG